VRGRPSLFSRSTDELRFVVLHKRDLALVLEVPILVGDEAVPVAVGAGKQCGVSRPGAGVGVVVAAVGKVGAMVEE